MGRGVGNKCYISWIDLFKNASGKASRKKGALGLKYGIPELLEFKWYQEVQAWNSGTTEPSLLN